MGAIKDVRDALVADLSEVMPTFQQVPRRFAAPGLLVLTPRSGTYIQGGQTFGSVAISLEVWIVIRAHSGDELADLDELDGYAEQVIQNTADWSLQGVDVPVIANIDGADYPVTVIHLSKQTKL